MEARLLVCTSAVLQQCNPHLSSAGIIFTGEITVKIYLFSSFFYLSRDSRIPFCDTDKHIRLPYSGQNKWQYIAVLEEGSFRSHRKTGRKEEETECVCVEEGKRGRGSNCRSKAFGRGCSMLSHAVVRLVRLQRRIDISEDADILVVEHGATIISYRRSNDLTRRRVSDTKCA